MPLPSIERATPLGELSTPLGIKGVGESISPSGVARSMKRGLPLPQGNGAHARLRLDSVEYGIAYVVLTVKYG